MVKRSINKIIKKSRYSRPGVRSLATPTLYPALADSLIMYFNYTVTYTDAATPSAAFYGAYFPLNVQGLVNLRPYFSQFRVERVTVRVMVAEQANVSQIHMATTHSADGATAAANTPTLQGIKAYRDYQVFSPVQNCPKKIWTMDPNDIYECQFSDIPAAANNVDAIFTVGGVQLFVSQVVGAGNSSFFAHVKFMVRLKGKQAFAV